MSEREHPSSPQGWFEKANRDWQQIEERLRDDETEDAAFMLHQSLEKYLKGYYVSRKWEIQHTHNLADLLVELIKDEPSFKDFQDLCEEISEFYFLEWSPSPEKIPSREKIEETMQQATILVERIKSGL